MASRFEKHWEGRSLSASIVRSVEPAGAAGAAGEEPAPRRGILPDDPSGAATCRALMVVQGIGDSPAGIAHELAHVVCRHAAEQVRRRGSGRGGMWRCTLRGMVTWAWRGIWAAQ